jgi:hypothetical protein
MASLPSFPINNPINTAKPVIDDFAVTASLQLRALELRVTQLHRRMRNLKYDGAEDPRKDSTELQETLRKEAAEVQESLNQLQTWMRESHHTSAIMPRPFAL